MKRLLRRVFYQRYMQAGMGWFMGFFYDPEFLTGRHFKNTSLGWKWALRGVFSQKMLGRNGSAKWPITGPVTISNPNRIHFHADDLNNFNTCFVYFQCFSADIYIGKGTYIAPNVGLITAGHDPDDPDHHLPGKDIRLGEKCWIGMNAVILPGVILGPKTVVGAGAVVTKSFPNGYVILAGVPAKVIKMLKEPALP